MPTDCPIELPAAISTRAAISAPNVGASTVAIAPPPYTSNPSRWTRLRPTMSASRPSGIISALIVSACAITTQETSRSVTPKSSAIAASATKTIEMLITWVKKEIPIALKAHHL